MLPALVVAFLVLWGLFWGYWISRARSSGKGERSEASSSRVIHAALLISALALLTIAQMEPFSMRILPDAGWLAWVGFCVTLLGLLFAVWARSHLGKYWSGAIIFQKDHQLIQSGPYALTRHPIYTGILAAILGTAIAIDELRGFLAFFLALVAYYRKIRMEEDQLALRFGEEFKGYEHQVKMLIPFVV